MGFYISRIVKQYFSWIEILLLFIRTVNLSSIYVLVGLIWNKNMSNCVIYFFIFYDLVRYGYLYLLEELKSFENYAEKTYQIWPVNIRYM